MNPFNSNEFFDGWSVKDLGYFHELLREMGFLFLSQHLLLPRGALLVSVLFVRCVHVVGFRPQQHLKSKHGNMAVLCFAPQVHQTNG